MRLLINKIVLLLSTFSAITGVALLGWILFTLVSKGITSFHISLFFKDLVDGGLRNLIVGQFIMAGIASLIAIPIGMLAGIYLQEYGKGIHVRIIRDLSDVMMSAPSVVIGAFIFAILVLPFEHTSGLAGIASLSIMMIPIIISTTDNMLSLVPRELREAGIALGASKYKVIIDIIIKAAKVGIVTGILLSFGRIIGETAPLLFTSETSLYFTLDLTGSFPSMTVSIYDLANQPQESSRDLAWAASFILTTIVLMINIVGRILSNMKKGR